MRRRLLNLVAVLSLLAGAAVVAAWVSSFRYDDYYQRVVGQRHYNLRSLRGRVSFSWTSPHPGWRDHRGGGRTRQPVPGPGQMPHDTLDGGCRWRLLGFGFDRYAFGFGPGTAGAQTSYTLVAPHGSLAAACLLLPLARAAAFVRRWRRGTVGACAADGDNIRATPERCPECGRAPAALRPAGGAGAPPRRAGRHVRRHLLNALTAGSLLLCVAALALWVRSYRRADLVWWHGYLADDGVSLMKHRYSTIASGNGGAWLLRQDVTFAGADYAANAPGVRALYPPGPPDVRWDPSRNMNQLRADPGAWSGFQHDAVTSGTPTATFEYRTVRVPYWALAAATGALPLWRLSTFRRHRRRRRLAAGLCPGCGSSRDESRLCTAGYP